jgi:hypothetical protein
MGSSSRRVYAFIVCVRDEDKRTFEFRTTSDATDLTSRVTAAISNGRQIRFYVLAADADAQDREARFLTGKGYKRGSVLV